MFLRLLSSGVYCSGSQGMLSGFLSDTSFAYCKRLSNNAVRDGG